MKGFIKKALKAISIVLIIFGLLCALKAIGTADTEIEQISAGRTESSETTDITEYVIYSISMMVIGGVCLCAATKGDKVW